jgi:hypothetical protein
MRSYPPEPVFQAYRLARGIMRFRLLFLSTDVIFRQDQQSILSEDPSESLLLASWREIVPSAEPGLKISGQQKLPA